MNFFYDFLCVMNVQFQFEFYFFVKTYARINKTSFYRNLRASINYIWFFFYLLLASQLSYLFSLICFFFIKMFYIFCWLGENKSVWKKVSLGIREILLFNTTFRYIVNTNTNSAFTKHHTRKLEYFPWLFTSDISLKCSLARSMKWRRKIFFFLFFLYFIYLRTYNISPISSRS